MKVPNRAVVEAKLEYSFKCPKCGKWCAASYKIATCNKCGQKVTLVLEEKPDI